MSAPVSQLSRLSLDNMPPTTRSMSRPGSAMVSPSYQSVTESNSSIGDDSDSDDFDWDEDAPPVVRSPTRLLYRLDNLSAEARNAVRDAFHDPPRIALQRCRRIDGTYAFQMTELVTRSVRIRASEDEGSSLVTCSYCNNDDDDEEHRDTRTCPCPHLLWLLDQLLKQTLYHHDRNEPLTMDPRGYAQEMGDPFQSISRHHLDVLAAGIHCPVVGPDSEGHVDPTRTLEARELLASIYSAAPDQFRPDIFDHPVPGRRVLKRNDLDRSFFRMLLDNGHFFQYLLSLSRPSDPINDPFRKLSQRVDLVLRSLDAAADASSLSAAAATASSSSTSARDPREHPITVAWAARHVHGCVGDIRSALYSRDHPLRAPEALSAASTLVHILSAVVSRNRDITTTTTPTHNEEGGNTPRTDRNLYLRLVGDRDQDFVIGVLALIPEAASQFLDALEDILERIGVHGAPASYVDKFRALLARLRASRIGSGFKRQGQGQASSEDRRSKRRR